MVFAQSSAHPGKRVVPLKFLARQSRRSVSGTHPAAVEKLV